jgi:hypothetical protein
MKPTDRPVAEAFGLAPVDGKMSWIWKTAKPPNTMQTSAQMPAWKYCLDFGITPESIVATYA